MRFVHLQDENNKKSPYDNILQYGCGPNFVLSRQKEFMQMIKDQDLIFWFRFWLLFSFNPGSEILKTIQDHWPVTATQSKIVVHNKFLLVSVQEACDFCLNAIKLLQSPTAKKTNLKSEKDVFKQLMQECTEMAFGAAMCDVFHKWLNTDKQCGNQDDYWIVPQHYLCTNFIPGDQEMYLVKHWRENLVSLLGVSFKKVLWIKKMLHQIRRHLAVAKMVESDKCHDYTIWNRKIMAAIGAYRAGIKKVDALTNCQDKVIDKKLTKNSHCVNDVKVTKKRQLSFKLKKHKDIRQCSNCLVIEKMDEKFKKCKLCVEEHWPKPKYYCCRSCQVEDWYDNHDQEHFRFVTKAFSDSDDDTAEYGKN